MLWLIESFITPEFLNHQLRILNACFDTQTSVPTKTSPHELFVDPTFFCFISIKYRFSNHCHFLRLFHFFTSGNPRPTCVFSLRPFHPPKRPKRRHRRISRQRAWFALPKWNECRSRGSDVWTLSVF